jgi:ABC-type branched-subunit amino acid transport system permease subunit
MPLRYLINTLLIAALLLIGNAVMGGEALNRATRALVLQIGIYIILAVSLNIMTGYLGQLPLGHAGFMAVGAYAGALFWKAAVLLPCGPPSRWDCSWPAASPPCSASSSACPPCGSRGTTWPSSRWASARSSASPSST